MTEPAELPGADPTHNGRRDRIAGIDLARALAIIGMFAVHISPSGTSSAFAYVLAVPRGRSAILFGLLAGVGVSLLASSRTTSMSEARMSLLWRAAVLLPIGLGMQLLDHNVLVILADYAVLFLVAAVVVRWPDRALLVLAGVSAAAGSVGYLYGRLQSPAAFTRQPAEFGMAFLDAVHALVLSGPYPLITWTAPFCLGIWLGRRDLASPRVARRLVIAGATVAIVAPAASWAATTMIALVGGPADAGGWWQLLDDAPHSQTPLWLLSATGSAVAVLGISLMFADERPRVAAGRLAFTWYAAHLLVLHASPELLGTGTIPGAPGVRPAAPLARSSSPGAPPARGASGMIWPSQPVPLVAEAR